jgi:hypothetical protein
VKIARRAWLAVTLVVLALPSSASASHDTGLSFRGFGTATIDGVLAPAEWDGAGRYDFQADRAPSEGGGTVPATLFVMNDATNIYFALRVAVANLGYSAFDGIFLPAGPNPSNGGDVLRAMPWGFSDMHFHQTSPFTWDWLGDTADGGTQDGMSAAQAANGVAVYEVSHPLNSTDDRHDFSQPIPSHISWTGSFQHCVSGPCGTTVIPGPTGGRIVVVSGTRVPPETTITDGPPDGEELPDYGLYVFKGVDDVAPESEITFECKVDAEEWTSCESPFAPVTIPDGRHTLSIRALDDMLNADPTPAQRRWRTDSKSPSKPRVARSRRGKLTQFRFSARDVGTPTRRLRFRCAIDSKRLHACRSPYRVRLPAGRHVVRVSAVDPARNESSMRIARFLVH